MRVTKLTSLLCNTIHYSNEKDLWHRPEDDKKKFENYIARFFHRLKQMSLCSRSVDNFTLPDNDKNGQKLLH